MSNVPEGFQDWSLDEKSAYWDKQREKDRACRQKGIDKLSQEQRDAVKEAYDAISSAMMSLHECQDLWMSDVKKLDDSMWQLRRLFNLEVKDD
jgi:TRAP-type mannitol/chloroaromatic compound transport system substrate-binding protein